MRWVLCVAAVVAALAAAPSVIAAEDAPGRPTVCLVLSGGGARGAAHIGVLRTLEELRVPIDCIAGTSMGAIVGGYYAAGMSPDELEQLLAGANWADLFVDRPDRRNRSFRRKSDDRELLTPFRLRLGKEGVALPLGVVQGQKLDRLLKSAELKTTAEQDFDRLPIRFRAVAADVRTGERIVIADGGIARGVRASMSVPGLFAPVERDGRLLVDGGITENLPVSVAREMGADVLVVVDISTPLDPQARVESLVDVLDLTSTIMTARTVEQAKTLLGERDILIECDPGIPYTDFPRAVEVVDRGAEAARAHAAELSRLAVAEDDFAAYMARRQRRPLGPVRIDEVRFENTTPISDKVLLAQLGVKPGDSLDADRVTNGLVHLYGLEYFEPLSFDIERDADLTRLLVRAPQRRDGLDSLQFGLRFEDDFQGGDEFTITARYDVLAVNRLGGEWRTTVRLGDTEQVSTEFYQPLGASMRWFVAPELDYRRETVPLLAEGRIVAEYNRAGYYALISAGRIFGDWGALSVSLARGEFDADPRIGERSLPEDDVSRTTGSLTILVDTLDSVTWPRRGLSLLADYSRELPNLGADARTARFLLRADKAGRWKRLGAVLGVEWATDLSPEDSREPAIELGGLFRLSGYGPSELVGERGGLLRIFSYYRLTEEKFLFLRPGLYVGLSLEAGAVASRSAPLAWDDTLLGAAVLVGADTFFGPVYFGYGWSEPDKDRFFLSLGRAF